MSKQLWIIQRSFQCISYRFYIEVKILNYIMQNNPSIIWSKIFEFSIQVNIINVIINEKLMKLDQFTKLLMKFFRPINENNLTGIKF
jgi:hypothetical protein